LRSEQSVVWEYAEVVLNGSMKRRLRKQAVVRTYLKSQSGGNTEISVFPPTSVSFGLFRALRFEIGSERSGDSECLFDAKISAESILFTSEDKDFIFFARAWNAYPSFS